MKNKLSIMLCALMASGAIYIPEQCASQQPRSNHLSLPVATIGLFGSLMGGLYAFRRLSTYINRRREETEIPAKKTEGLKGRTEAPVQNIFLAPDVLDDLNRQAKQVKHSLKSRIDHLEWRDSFKEIIGYPPADNAPGWWMREKIEQEKEQAKKRRQAMISEIAIEVSTKIATKVHVTNSKLLRLYPQITLWTHEYMERLLHRGESGDSGNKRFIEALRLHQELKTSLADLMRVIVFHRYKSEVIKDANVIRSAVRLNLILRDVLNENPN